MPRRIAVVLILITLTLSTRVASAQRVEASFSVGYSASEGITSDQRPLLGQLYDTLAVDSGASVNFTFGVFLNEKTEVEFLWARQNSRLQADGDAGKLPLAELVVYNYMANFVFNGGPLDARVRPFFFGGFGATKYSFGETLLAGSFGSLEVETRFATNWGGGAKFYFSPNVGAKVMLRWTPTHIKSDPAGIWCDPFYGCWALADAQYSNQFETSGGITLRFE